MKKGLRLGALISIVWFGLATGVTAQMHEDEKKTPETKPAEAAEISKLREEPSVTEHTIPIDNLTFLTKPLRAQRS